MAYGLCTLELKKKSSVAPVLCFVSYFYLAFPSIISVGFCQKSYKHITYDLCKNTKAYSEKKVSEQEPQFPSKKSDEPTGVGEDSWESLGLQGDPTNQS